MAQIATVTSHGIRAVLTLAILPRVADPTAHDAPARADTGASAGAKSTAGEAKRGLAPEIRGWAIFGEKGILEASGSGSGWLEAGRAVLAAADVAATEEATHVHVATEDGEVFAVRLGDLAMVAVTDRFALASLVFADMRSALRDAVRGRAAQVAEAA